MKPGNKKGRALLKRANAAHTPPKGETLEDKIMRLYREGHYTGEDVEWSVSIPGEYGVDPFGPIDVAVIYWADQRNIDQLYKDLAYNKAESEKGNYTVLKTHEE